MTVSGYATAAGQKALWGGQNGEAWVAAQDLLDDLFRPLEAMLVDSVDEGARVLDIGCGTGSTTVAIARKAGANGRAVGVDISEPMIAAARRRASSAEFIRADAQDYRFEPESFDLIASRFGVMFFSDPVAAFTNLRRAARPLGGMRLLAWRGMADNPFMTAAERAAAPLLPDLPVRKPDAPGQFAFADRDRVRRILEQGGWTDIDIHPVDVPCTMPADQLEFYFTRLGPVGLTLGSADDALRARVVETVRPAFEPFIEGPVVRFTAACWSIGAINA
ncbi:methyltransferase domain-containing protein [Sphingomonas sp. MAH-20]|uniref:Methyltransferase domain-containing protein n=1 Tax=Sphingomonas horti TaxID=2682842 RepID=A0A6I4J453_9SPHN|nr:MULTISPECIES: class I SAM-dependent methyltransferase [Sphingomonas]MBA2921218.1 methyltransferase domain-containing protein [Sphingomonas sp. CGMCC 1.13658]MVO79459.1 methyltransferase domain-containing protein [Sphingomonas horti]